MFSNDFLSEKTISEVNKIKEIEQKINGNDLIYKTGNKKKGKKYDFQKFKTIRSFGRDIYSINLSLDDALEEKVNLSDEIISLQKFKKYMKPKTQEKKEQKSVTFNNAIRPLKEDKNFLMVLKVKYF